MWEISKEIENFAVTLSEQFKWRVTFKKELIEMKGSLFVFRDSLDSFTEELIKFDYCLAQKLKKVSALDADKGRIELPILYFILT